MGCFACAVGPSTNCSVGELPSSSSQIRIAKPMHLRPSCCELRRCCIAHSRKSGFTTSLLLHYCFTTGVAMAPSGMLLQHVPDSPLPTRHQRCAHARSRPPLQGAKLYPAPAVSASGLLRSNHLLLADRAVRLAAVPLRLTASHGVPPLWTGASVHRRQRLLRATARSTPVPPPATSPQPVQHGRGRFPLHPGPLTSQQ